MEKKTPVKIKVRQFERDFCYTYEQIDDLRRRELEQAVDELEGGRDEVGRTERERHRGQDRLQLLLLLSAGGALPPLQFLVPGLPVPFPGGHDAVAPVVARDAVQVGVEQVLLPAEVRERVEPVEDGAREERGVRLGSQVHDVG